VAAPDAVGVEEVDFLYALALAVGADLVSGDPHLLELGKSSPVRVFSPRELIEELERSR
jgi:predicted nucleic acid-binding protein